MTKTELELWHNAGQIIGLCMKNGLNVEETRKSVMIVKDIMEGKCPE